MIKIYRKVLVLALLALPLLSQAQSLDTVVTKQLKTGWNLVGYMGQTPEQTQEAFAGIKDKLLEVKSMDGFYNPDQQAYLNSLKTLNPLDGVMVKVSQDCELKRTIKKSAILYHDAEKQSLADVLAIGNSAKGQIKNVSDPTDPQDAVNKASVTLRVSATGDSLFMGKAQFVIIPGISAANPVSIVQKLKIELVSISAGTFTMGSPATEVNHESGEVEHQVTLSAFKMSKYEITNAQYAAFLNAKSIGSNGTYAAGAYPTQALIYATSGSYDWGLHYNTNKWEPVAGYENNPVINVTWYGATEFATYAGGTLPTEAQWEYACRAGTSTPFNTGDFLTNLQANYDWAYPYNGGTNTATTSPGKPQAVGTYAANAWGLHDMHGNVWEWCSDWYGTYPTTSQNNPTGATTGSHRVHRGGGWSGSAQDCRSAYRNRNYPSYGNSHRGFRVVLVP